MTDAILILIASAAWLWRVEWVYRVRVKMIYDDFERYKRLPSYLSMALQVWIWDVNKFRGKHG
jgi:hypothetical protein